MAKIESHIVVNVTADTKDLKQTIADGIKAAFRDGHRKSEEEDLSVEVAWGISETKKVYDKLLK